MANVAEIHTKKRCRFLSRPKPASGIVPLMKAALLLISKPKDSNAELSSYIKDATILLGSSIFASEKIFVKEGIIFKIFNCVQCTSECYWSIVCWLCSEKDLADFDKCKRKTGYYWQPYNSFWEVLNILPILEEIWETAEIMV